MSNIDKVYAIWENPDKTYNDLPEKTRQTLSRRDFFLKYCNYNNGKVSFTRLKNLLGSELENYTIEQSKKYENLLSIFSAIEARENDIDRFTNDMLIAEFIVNGYSNKVCKTITEEQLPGQIEFSVVQMSIETLIKRFKFVSNIFMVTNKLYRGINSKDLNKEFFLIDPATINNDITLVSDMLKSDDIELQNFGKNIINYIEKNYNSLELVLLTSQPKYKNYRKGIKLEVV